MKTVRSSAFFFMTLLGLAGCAAGSQAYVPDQADASLHTPTALVETLQKAPERPYKVLAKLHASAPAGTPPAQVIALLTKRAASLGAEAIIIHNESRSVPAQVQFNPSGGNYSEQPAQIMPIYSAEAIRWLPLHKPSS